MDKNKALGDRTLSITIGLMVLGLFVIGGMGTAPVEEWNKTFVETNNDLFTISALKPSINITVPNGGENWHAGTTKKIKWKYIGNPGSRVKIELLKGKKKIGTINSNVSIGRKGNGSYKWSINSTQEPGMNYKIRITSKSNPLYKDNSNNNFTMSPAKSFSKSMELARELAYNITQATTNESRYRALLSVMEALNIGVYNASGYVIVEGAERGPEDFYLYDFELKAIGGELGRKQNRTLSEIASILNASGIHPDNKSLASEMLQEIIVNGTQASIQDPENNTSLGMLLVREIGLLQQPSMDTSKNISFNDSRFDTLQYFLIITDIIVPMLPEPNNSGMTSKLSASIPLPFPSHSSLTTISPGQGRLCDFVNDPEFQKEWKIGKYAAGYTPLSDIKKYGALLVDMIHQIDLNLLISVEETSLGPLGTHYGPQEAAHKSNYPLGQNIRLQISVKMQGYESEFKAETVTCGKLFGLTLPKAGGIPNIPVDWENLGGVKIDFYNKLKKHGEIIEADSMTDDNGLADFVFKPKDELSDTIPVRNDEDFKNVQGNLIIGVRTSAAFGNILGEIIEDQYPKEVVMPALTIEFHEPKKYDLLFDSTITGKHMLYSAKSHACGYVHLNSDGSNNYIGIGSLNYATTPITTSNGIEWSGIGTVTMEVMNGQIGVIKSPPDISIPMVLGVTKETGKIRDRGKITGQFEGSFWATMFAYSEIMPRGTLIIDGWTYVGKDGMIAEKTLQGNCNGYCTETTHVYIMEKNSYNYPDGWDQIFCN